MPIAEYTPVPAYTVNGVEVTEEEYRNWCIMMNAVNEGERAEAAAYEQQLQLIRPLTPEETLRAVFAAQPVIANAIPDEFLGRMQPYFPRWESGILYTRHVSFVTYGEGDGYLWRCETTHTSQDDWTPDISPGLWSKVLTSITDILPWVQPDSTNPYMEGDKVIWDGAIWESNIDNNVWMPGVYGWTKIKDI